MDKSPASADAALRDRGLLHLRAALNNSEAEFRDGQWEAIESLALEKSKLLVVQRTGWGKSIVYFIATKLLREAGSGPTLLVSPLLSLMRNQIEAASRLGIVAETINSMNSERWGEITDRLLSDGIDILLISPERLANEDFVSRVLSAIAPRVGLFVVDEAHCISDWGHDFRPDYMRIARILRGLPPSAPALATTATANDRVVADIVTQLGSNLKVIRGPLARQTLRLQNIDMPSPAARMAWLAEKLPKLPGSGIVYTLTVRDAERVARWLRHKGIEAHAYHAEESQLPRDERLVLEQKLLKNDLKALVATVALGMGFDKPDLGFVVHFQRPGSVVHYYQQVGRAGRAVDSAYGILLGGREDDEISDYFIQSAFPPQAHVGEVLKALEGSENGLSVHQMMRSINLNGAQVQKVMTILSAQSPSPIVKQGAKYHRTATEFTFDAARVERLIDIRKREQATMQEYMRTQDCLMRFLASELDDPHAAKCGICASCAGRPLVPPDYDTALAAEATTFLRRSDVIIEPRLMWPLGSEDEKYKGKMSENLRAEPGRALCMWGDAGWGDLVRRGKQQDGRFSQDLVIAAAELVRTRWKPDPFPEWITCVPSLHKAMLVPDFARRLAIELNIRFRNCIMKVRDTAPQKLMHNSHQQLNNIKDAFDLDDARVLPGPALLVDDMTDSKWTFTVVAALLRSRGCGQVFPLALASVW
ncbi:MAG: RecQ family ATP-dependent DNA helicase [Armatimonadota bacterium]|nr:RecQ family ATP-dependent DNA helicase [Armatimonadota bacterium]